MNNFRITFVLAIATAVSCQHLSPEAKSSPASKLLLDPATEIPLFVAAAKDLDLKDNARLWLKIANSEKYSRRKRQIAALQIFARNVHRGTTLAELRNLYGHTTWFSYYTDPLGSGSGVLHIEKENRTDAMFRLRIFPEDELGVERGGDAELRLTVKGPITWDRFYRYLTSNVQDEGIGSLIVLQIASYEISPKRFQSFSNAYGLRIFDPNEMPP